MKVLLSTPLAALSASLVTWFFLEKKDLQDVHPVSVPPDLTEFPPAAEPSRALSLHELVSNLRRAVAEKESRIADLEAAAHDFICNASYLNACTRSLGTSPHTWVEDQHPHEGPGFTFWDTAQHSVALLQDVAEDAMGLAAKQVWPWLAMEQNSSWLPLVDSIQEAATGLLQNAITDKWQNVSLEQPEFLKSIFEAVRTIEDMLADPVSGALKSFLKRHPEHTTILSGRHPLLILAVSVALFYLVAWELYGCVRLLVAITGWFISMARCVLRLPCRCYDKCCHRRLRTEPPAINPGRHIDAFLFEQSHRTGPQTMGASQTLHQGVLNPEVAVATPHSQERPLPEEPPAVASQSPAVGSRSPAKVVQAQVVLSEPRTESKAGSSVEDDVSQSPAAISEPPKQSTGSCMESDDVKPKGRRERPRGGKNNRKKNHQGKDVTGVQTEPQQAGNTQQGGVQREPGPSLEGVPQHKVDGCQGAVAQEDAAAHQEPLAQIGAGQKPKVVEQQETVVQQEADTLQMKDVQQGEVAQQEAVFQQEAASQQEVLQQQEAGLQAVPEQEARTEESAATEQAAGMHEEACAEGISSS